MEEIQELELPHNTQLEQSVLGTLIVSPEEFPVVYGQLTHMHFYTPEHRVLYKVLSDMFTEGIPIDIITLNDQLRKLKKVTAVGGLGYVSGLMDLGYFKSHLKAYSKSIKDMATRRSLADMGGRITNLAMSEDMKLTDIIEASTTGIFDVAREGVRVTTDNRDIISEYKSFKEEYKDLKSGDIMGMKTGIDALDTATMGLIPNHIWVCGAYYGYGKTYFAINLIDSVLRQGKRVMFFSLEMTSSEIIQRLVSLRCGIGMAQTVGEVDDTVYGLRNQAEEEIFAYIKSGRLVIDDDCRDGDNLVARMIIEDMREHIDFVALDYLQLLAGDDQYESLRLLTKKLQGATKQIHTTTLLLSQVSNSSQEAGYKSNTDGFKGAGDIGQIANVAMKIFREKINETGEFTDRYVLRLTKVRHGKPCSIECTLEFPGGRIKQSLFGETLNASSESDKVLEFFKGL